MLVEIPELEVILGGIVAFLVGLIGLYGFYKIRPFVKSNNDVSDISQTERLEYYERQLIDMKIRLDALEIQGIEQKSEDPNLELKGFLEKLVMNQSKEKKAGKSETIVKKSLSTPNIPRLDYTNPVDYVLQLITDKDMTSRDIQITLKRSREHTSRLMKKLFENGLVQRNIESKPYTYSITDKGKERIAVPQPTPITT